MDLLQRLFYTAVSASAIFYFVVKISLSYWKRRGILHEKPKFLWGNLKGVGRKRHITTVLHELYTKYKGKAPFIGCYALLKPIVCILDLNVIRHILSSDAVEYFSDRGLYYNIGDDALSANLMQLDGADWQLMHERCQSAFATQQMHDLLPGLQKVATTFARSLHDKQSTQDIFVINELVQCYNEDVISALAFGLEGNSLKYEHTEFRQMTRSYYRHFHLLKAFLAWQFPHLARTLQYKSYDQAATTYFVRLVNDALKQREWQLSGTPQQQQRSLDFMQLFATLKRASGRSGHDRLSNKEIAAQAFSFIFAGLEACNATLSFCLYELALQPEIQQRVREEIIKVLAQHKETLSAQCLQDMPYLKQVLHETLRKYSPYPFLLRRTIKDYEVPNSVFMLQRDNELIIPIAAIHHDPEIYPEPDRFDPDRFLPAACEKRSKVAFLPFGMGPRSCIATLFAEQQLLIGLVTLLKQYQFSPCAETSIPLQYDNTKLVLSPKADLRLRLERI